MLVAKSWRPNGEDPPLACALSGGVQTKTQIAEKGRSEGFLRLRRSIDSCETIPHLMELLPSVCTYYR